MWHAGGNLAATNDFFKGRFEQGSLNGTHLGGGSILILKMYLVIWGRGFPQKIVHEVWVGCHIS